MNRDVAHLEPAAGTARARVGHGHPPGPKGLPAALRTFQRGAGNRAIQRMLASAVLQRACDCGTCEKCQAKYAHGHGRGEETLSGGFLSGKGSGQPLGESVRGFMEERFGHHFGGVRVHTDGHAARSARDISAVAYTAGSDIFFAPGHYRPDSHEGRHLLAHELTHVIQQGGASMSAQAQLSVGAADDACEREADRVADAVMGSGAAAPPITPFAPAAVQRHPCVTGSFDGASAHYRVAVRQENARILDVESEEDAKAVGVESSEEDARSLSGRWNRRTGWYESPLKIEAGFQTLGERGHCADGELRLYAYGDAERYEPWAIAAAHRSGSSWADWRASEPAEMRLQASPDKPRLEPAVRERDRWESGKTEFVRYLPHAGNCRIEAHVVPGIRAERAGEYLDGRLVIVGELVDTCDPGARRAPSEPFEAKRVLDRMVCALDVDFEVPKDFDAGDAKRQSGAQAPGSEVKDRPAQAPEKKASAPGKPAEATGPAPAGAVSGEFTNIPSGRLVAAWDPARKRFGREFYMRARFEPLGPASDCREGEYRQFVQAQWIRQRRGGKAVEDAPSREQPQEVRTRLCEDTVTEKEGKDDAMVTMRYGYRADKFKYSAGNSLYGPDSLLGCLFEGWDHPHITPGEAGERVEIHFHFLGQLIDKALAGRQKQDFPYTKGVLAQSDWWIDGTFTAPDDYVPPPPEAKVAPNPRVQNTGTRPANMRGTTKPPGAQGNASEKKGDATP